MISQLCPELLENLFKYLSLKDIKNLSLCSRECNEALTFYLFRRVKIIYPPLNVYVPEDELPFHTFHTFHTCTDDYKDKVIFEKLRYTYNLEIGTAPRYSLVPEESKEKHFTNIFGSCSDRLTKITIRAPCGIIFDSAFLHLPRGCESLQEVVFNGEIDGKCITDEGLKNLASIAKNIKVLDIYNCEKLTGIGFENFRSSNSLRKLRLVRHSKLTDDIIVQINCIASLQDLTLGTIRMSHDALEMLSGLKHLLTFDLSCYNKLTGDCMKYVSPFVTLTTLNISSNTITDIGLPYLACLRHLNKLQANHCGLKGEDFSSLEKLPHLSYLSVTNNPLTVAGLEQLSLLRVLTYLDLSHCPIDDKSLPPTLSTTLNELHLHFTGMSEESVMNFQLRRPDVNVHVSNYDSSNEDLSDNDGLGRHLWNCYGSDFYNNSSESSDSDDGFRSYRAYFRKHEA